MDPVGMVLKPFKSRDEGLVERYRNYLEDLLNITLSRDPGKAYRAYVVKMQALRKGYKELCVSIGERRYCLYQYKELSAREYMKTPVLAAMRGYVLEWFSNGDCVVRAFPFAKFFNHGEVAETESLPEGRFEATLKLDGTLIICWRDEDGALHCNTRGLLEWFGVQQGKGRIYTYRGEGVENPYVKAFYATVKARGLWHELESLVRDGRTTMFELVGDIPASQMAYRNIADLSRIRRWEVYALAARDHKTLHLEYLEETAFPQPERLTGRPGELLEAVKEWKDREGIVLHYPGLTYREGESFKWWNYMVKLKSLRYGLMSFIMFGDKVIWRNVAKATITGFYDDLTVLGIPEVASFAEQVHSLYRKLAERWSTIVESVKNGALTETRRNLLIHNMKLGYLVRLAEEGVRRGESPLKRLLVQHMPRKKDDILGFMERLLHRLDEFDQTLRS